MEIPRIRKAFLELGEDFVRKVLTPPEEKIFHRRKQSMEFLAGRFAIKEAAAKALGTGLRAKVSMKHFTCLEGKRGEPVLTLDSFALTTYNNHCRKGLAGVQSVRAYASISHTYDLAQGLVILAADL